MNTFSAFEKTVKAKKTEEKTAKEEKPVRACIGNIDNLGKTKAMKNHTEKSIHLFSILKKKQWNKFSVFEKTGKTKKTAKMTAKKKSQPEGLLEKKIGEESHCEIVETNLIKIKKTTQMNTSR